MISRRAFSSVSRVFFTSNKTGSGSSSKKSPKKESTTKSKEEPVVEQFKNDSYNAPEYFAHNKFSYADVMVNLSGYRLPQKSNKVPS